MINKFFTLRSLSPVHCGIGQGLNDIDLPTARNSVSGHPIVPASSIKGVLKDEFINNGLGEKIGKKVDDKNWKEKARLLFGDITIESDSKVIEFASSLSVGDANLLALPVRSFFGTFAYLSSPYSLQQLKNLYRRTDLTVQIPGIPTIGLRDDNGCYKAIITENSLLKQDSNNSIYLEEMDLLIEKENDLADKWANFIAPLFFNDTEGQDIFKKRFAVVDDNALNFSCNCGLPVDARTSIDQETGTVKDGALWYEETVPPESLFVGIMGVNRSYGSNSDKKISATDLANFFTTDSIYCQIGGKATTGKGFVAINFV